MKVSDDPKIFGKLKY